MSTERINERVSESRREELVREWQRVHVDSGESVHAYLREIMGDIYKICSSTAIAEGLHSNYLQANRNPAELRAIYNEIGSQLGARRAAPQVAMRHQQLVRAVESRAAGVGLYHVLVRVERLPRPRLGIQPPPSWRATMACALSPGGEVTDRVHFFWVESVPVLADFEPLLEWARSRVEEFALYLEDPGILRVPPERYRTDYHYNTETYQSGLRGNRPSAMIIDEFDPPAEPLPEPAPGPPPEPKLPRINGRLHREIRL